MSGHIFGLWLLHLGQLTVSDRKVKKTRLNQEVWRQAGLDGFAV